MRKQGILHAEVDILIPFFDIDSMDVVWHGHYVKYLEIARCALLDKINYGYMQMRESGFAWPVIDLQLRYIRPARFNQKVSVRADLVEWENRLKLNYLMCDAATGERMSRGSSVQVAVEMTTGEMQLVSPKVLLDAVKRSLP